MISTDNNPYETSEVPHFWLSSLCELPFVAGGGGSGKPFMLKFLVIVVSGVLVVVFDLLPRSE
jgi:hypothetical protein